MTGQWFYPVFTVVKSLSAKTKPDSCDLQNNPRTLNGNFKKFGRLIQTAKSSKNGRFSNRWFLFVRRLSKLPRCIIVRQCR
jgi:hypothetical protein